jgi:hypothetical protein
LAGRLRPPDKKTNRGERSAHPQNRPLPQPLTSSEWKRPPNLVNISLNDLNKIGGHPKVDLPETNLHPFLKIAKKLSMLRFVSDIDEHSNQASRKERSSCRQYPRMV